MRFGRNKLQHGKEMLLLEAKTLSKSKLYGGISSPFKHFTFHTLHRSQNVCVRVSLYLSLVGENTQLYQ